jgi:hypothetical protein
MRNSMRGRRGKSAGRTLESGLLLPLKVSIAARAVPTGPVDTGLGRQKSSVRKVVMVNTSFFLPLRHVGDSNDLCSAT